LALAIESASVIKAKIVFFIFDSPVSVVSRPTTQQITEAGELLLCAISRREGGGGRWRNLARFGAAKESWW
jgi:hypothetical protein